MRKIAEVENPILRPDDGVPIRLQRLVHRAHVRQAIDITERTVARFDDVTVAEMSVTDRPVCHAVAPFLLAVRMRRYACQTVCLEQPSAAAASEFVRLPVNAAAIAASANTRLAPGWPS